MKILQMSDFHLGKNEELEKKKLDSLAEWIKRENIEFDYLIYTGDIIDSPVVVKQCLCKMKEYFTDEYKGISTSNSDEFLLEIRKKGLDHIRKYNEFLRDYTNVAMDKAFEIFKKFITYIGIKQERIVMCCGNHDRIRYLDEDKFECKNKKIDEERFLDDYSAYNSFCSKINMNFSNGTCRYKHDGFNFVIANSNWKTPKNDETNNMCINCGKIFDILKEIENESNFQRKKNFFILHKPFDDICENAKYHYSRDRILSLKEMIERTSAICLYGDKHSFGVNTNSYLKEFMCGKPISEKDVRYNLIDYNDLDGSCTSSFIFYKDDNWCLVPMYDCMRKAYEISKDYLKSFSLKILFDNEEKFSEWDSAILNIERALKEERFLLAAKLVSPCCRLKIQNQKQEIREDIFEHFYELIKNSNLRKAVSVKGKPGIGKSTFLTIEYLYMFYKFYNGESKYCPFYFNLDNILMNEISHADFLDSDIDVIEAIQKCFSIFSQFLEKCLFIGEQYNVPVCLIVDGLEKNNLLLYSDKSVEALIYNLLEKKLKNHNGKYVMGLNTHKGSAFEDTFEQVNRFQSVVYLKPVRIIPYKEDNKNYEEFLEAYLTLRQEKELEKIKKVLPKVRRSTIDLKFLHQNYDLIHKFKIEDESWNTMKLYERTLSDKIEEKFGTEIKHIQEAAYLAFLEGKTYQEIVNDGNNKRISLYEFIQLCNNLDLAEHLIANLFIEELNTYSYKDDIIPKESILNCFLTRDQSIMIRLIFDNVHNENNRKKIIDNFTAKHSKQLSGYLLSTILYLIGHNKTSQNGENILMKKVLERCPKEENEFFTLCNQRSRELAKVVSENENNFVSTYVCNLMDDEQCRCFNREYQLHYYGDIQCFQANHRETWNIKKSYGIGFDFRNCFLVLSSKLRFSFERQMPYPLMELDLFTICDLIYSRLQNFGVDRAFFYTKDYHTLGISILESVGTLLGEYLNNYEVYVKNPTENKRIKVYFIFMKDKFETIHKQLEKNNLAGVIEPLVSQVYEFERIISLEAMGRVGWHINHTGVVKAEEQPKFSDYMKLYDGSDGIYPKETIMQAVIERVYIAQMFLPEKINGYDEYNKSTIISILLLSELGKIATGDYSPEYTTAKRSKFPKEQGELKKILILGALDGYANHGNLFNDLMVLVNSIMDSTSPLEYANINLLICQEIVQLQMEYKYCLLYKELEFDDERRQVFEEEFYEPKTDICKKIRKQLIKENPRFSGILKYE